MKSNQLHAYGVTHIYSSEEGQALGLVKND